MSIEGELTLRLAWDGRRVRSVAVCSTRPFAAPRVLIGRTPAAAGAMAPLLFSICAQAQGVAAAGAAEAATGATPTAPTQAARRNVVQLETIQEYLWRILIDWPKAMGHAPLLEPVAAARRHIVPVLAKVAPIARRIDGAGAPEAGTVPRALAAALADIASRHVYGNSPEAWLALTEAGSVGAWANGAQTLPARMLGELIADAAELGRSDVALMPGARREALLASVVPALRDTPDFAQAPRWGGAAVETGTLARMHAHPLVAAFRARFGNAVPTRMAARLVELAALLGGLGDECADEVASPWSQAFSLEGGEGLGAVQTARGLLLHFVRVAGNRVADYRIVAPTEWNFHPQGPLVRGLVGLVANDEATLARRARLAVQALDPCVACGVEVAHA